MSKGHKHCWRVWGMKKKLQVRGTSPVRENILVPKYLAWHWHDTECSFELQWRIQNLVPSKTLNWTSKRRWMGGWNYIICGHWPAEQSQGDPLGLLCWRAGEPCSYPPLNIYCWYCSDLDDCVYKKKGKNKISTQNEIITKTLGNNYNNTYIYIMYCYIMYIYI